jgi:nitrogen regulatory protein PII
MKAVVVITDSEAMRAFERAFVEAGERGFTIVPTLAGRGRSGFKTGDRVHPGGSSLLLTVVAESDLASVMDLLRDVRDRAGAVESTKIYAAAVDELA